MVHTCETNTRSKTSKENIRWKGKDQEVDRGTRCKEEIGLVSERRIDKLCKTDHFKHADLAVVGLVQGGKKLIKIIFFKIRFLTFNKTFIITNTIILK